jgi:gliding motility-associated lipoprotein GldH
MHIKSCFLTTFGLNLIRSGVSIAFFVLIVFLFSSCDDTIMHEELHHINEAHWKASDTIFFHFTVTDTTQPYDFGFDIRNTTSYDYQNLYLFITAWYPGGTWSRDTAECLLAASDGKWYGKGMGKIKDSRFVFRKGVRFRRSGNYTIGVNQAMRKENLEGISDIGIRISKTDNSPK